MNDLETSLRQRARNAVEGLESSVDREARSRTRYTLSRLAVGIGEALGLAVVAPIYWLVVLFQERSRDRERASAGQRDGAAVAGAGRQDPITIPTAIDSREVPLCVMPLADFARLGVPVPKDAGRRFVLLAPVVYEVEDTEPAGTTTDSSFQRVLAVPGQDHLRQVPNSFITDFASIPWFLQLIAEPAGQYGRAAVFHDWAYAYHHDGSHSGRKHCDRAMLNLMRRDGVPVGLRSLVYVALRIAGGWAFRSAPRRREETRPYAEALVFSFVGVQTFMLTYLARQMEDSGLLAALDKRAERTELSSGLWSRDIAESLQERLIAVLEESAPRARAGPRGRGSLP